MRSLYPDNLNARPFLKWAGGKTQLIPSIEAVFPYDAFSKNRITYVEPFVGGGAILFWFIKRFPNTKNVIINDINSDLINAYQVIKERPDVLIKELKLLEYKYRSLKSEEDKKQLFFEIRENFNGNKIGKIEKTTFLIFLNRTCFNGLYRVNSKNKFNVPFGKYKNPTICDPVNISNVSSILKNVKILNLDFEETLNYVSGKSFFYFDPPYRPLNKTSVFKSYSSNGFNDIEQQRLAGFCKKLSELKHLWLLSNSDPGNADKNDVFFDDLYSGFTIKRINASRRINSNGEKRGEITELLISNY